MALAELLCTDLAAVEVACALGADRIELCAALEVGGVTPSAGLLREAVALCRGGPEVIVLVRPWAGGFELGTPRDVDVLRADLEAAGAAGAAGVALGVTELDGTPSLDVLTRLVQAAGSLRTTYHRAFDLAPDPERALADLVDVGFDRILTSGGAPTAWAGREALASLVRDAAERIEIVAASGITGANAAEILTATGAPTIHGSCARSAAAEHGPVVGATDRPRLDRASAEAFVRAAHGIHPRNPRPERG